MCLYSIEFVIGNFCFYNILQVRYRLYIFCSRIEQVSFGGRILFFLKVKGYCFYIFFVFYMYFIEIKCLFCDLVVDVSVV